MGETQDQLVTSIRDHIVEALEHDLVGPYADDEVLPLPPSRWYLTGFLAPQGARELGDPTEDDDLGAGDDLDDEETRGPEPAPRQRSRLPASLGLSVLIPPGDSAAETLSATLSWADYLPEPGEEDGRSRLVWRRAGRGPVTVEVPLDQRALAKGVVVPNTVGLRLRGKIDEVVGAEAQGLERGTRALALFIVNERPVGEKGRADEQFIFQVRLELGHPMGLIPRPNVRDELADQWDERVADLQFRGRFEYAVGHGVSVEVPPADRPVTKATTTWLPRAEVRRVITREEPGVITSMEALGQLAGAEEVRAALGALVEAYTRWIVAQRQIDPGTPARRETRDELMRRAIECKDRIAAGVELLASDAEVREAFVLTNRAMAAAALQRSPERYDEERRPAWRLFQLAFVVMNLAGVAQDEHEDRETVELIFFPTGGGKTEAYLGLIGFTLLLRRLRGGQRPDKGLGVAVLLRYTLRLLTLDQLGRAATLICALELLRKGQPERLGEVRFAVGLWVGRSATANTMAEVAKKITEYKNASSKSAVSPFPLTSCPWCGKPLGRDSLTLGPQRTKPTEVVVGCLDFKCAFSRGKDREGLPMLFVDEQIYRELPSFIVATVDKFAMMPWRGEVGMLFGRATAREGRAFFGPMDKVPRAAERLPEGLWPPELIVQDELHLISGPLGTMVGLYETAIETLCSRVDGEGRTIGPKVVASTATVRRAQHQVKALFGRSRTALFPPPGIDDSETFFATIDHQSPGRLYVGLAAPGRAMKAILLRAYVDVLSAAGRVYLPEGAPEQTADGYMTLAGYFNSLRELGGMRRLVEDEVRQRASEWARRRPVNVGPKAKNPWFENRTISMEPVELTSRENTGKISETKARLGKPFVEKDHVDVLLASNMISVGVDIDRLGLMIVAGQPKTTSEYIQASSRVGRDTRWPGLVLTCFNLHKPRDRSHYERFVTYHQSFYRWVEAQSLTPFSGPALERGLAGTLLAMARLADPRMTEPEAAMMLSKHRDEVERWVEVLARRGGAQPGVDGDRERKVVEALTGRCRNLLDAWERLVVEAREGAAKRSYSRFDKDKAAGKPLLHFALDEDKPVRGTDEAKFVAPTSMRDVEPSVHFWLERLPLGGRR